MLGRYERLPPEEQRIVVITMLGGGASLWLAVAWEELMVLSAIPLLVGICWALIRAARRREERQKQEALY
jgi:hypothetical protein